MNEDSWTIRRYNPGDEIGYIALMNTVFPKYECDLEHWRWEFKDNPFGSIQTLSDFKGKIVGHMGLICVPIKIGNRIVLGSQAVDLAVHPSFRHRGMFLEIGKKQSQYAEDGEIVISYGVPNEPAYHGHIKYGWFLASEIPVLTKMMSKKGFFLFVLARFRDLLKQPNLTSALNFLKITKNLIEVFIKKKKHTSTPKFFEKHIVDHFDGRFDRFWEEISSQYPLLVVRNAKYLNWRYVKKPYSNYRIITVERNRRIEGYIVLGKSDSTEWKKGYIVDIFAKSEEAIHGLLYYALEYFVRENVDVIMCWMMKNQLPYNCLLQHGFINDHLDSRKFICRINIDSGEYGRLYHKVKKGWYFTMGDSDTI